MGFKRSQVQVLSPRLYIHHIHKESKTMDAEKRRSKRVKALFFVKIGLDVADSRKRWEENSAKNVSEHGLFINTSHIYEPGCFVTLLMRIPTQQTLDWIEAYGKVIECIKVSAHVNITRIEFLDLPPAVREAVKRYVDWASTK